MQQPASQWVTEAISQWGTINKWPIGSSRFMTDTPVVPAGPNPWLRSSSRRASPFPHAAAPFAVSSFYRQQSRFVPGHIPHSFTRGSPLSMGSGYVLRPGTASLTEHQLLRLSQSKPSGTPQLPRLSQSQSSARFDERTLMVGSNLRHRARNSSRAWGSSRMGLFTGEQNGMDMQAPPPLLCMPM